MDLIWRQIVHGNIHYNGITCSYDLSNSNLSWKIIRAEHMAAVLNEITLSLSQLKCKPDQIEIELSKHNNTKTKTL